MRLISLLLLVAQIVSFPFVLVTSAQVKRGKPVSKVSDDLFHLKLTYEQEYSSLANQGKFNGCVSSSQWRTKSAPNRMAYSYGYDHRNQLVEGRFFEGITAYTETNLNKVGPIEYDLSGNVTSIERVDEVNSVQVDHLQLQHSLSNQLMSAEENGDPNIGFMTSLSSGGYQYDNNGNLVQDDHHEIVDISYNHLNLPSKISYGGGEELLITYDANGRKLSKTYNANNNSVTKNYCQNVEYQMNDLEAIYHDHGRSIQENGNWQLEYFIADHLGNARVYFSDLDGNEKISTSEILQEAHYYPFGMELTNGVAQIGTENQYKYNGKELITDGGLNWYDYGARWYDPSIGKWQQVDPLAEDPDNIQWSNYGYVWNNPLRFVDPTGMKGKDTYSVNSDGEITRKDGKTYRNLEGQEVDLLVAENTGNSTYVEKNRLRGSGKQVTVSAEAQEFTTIPLGFDVDEDDAYNLFAWLGANTDVEWSFYKEGNSDFSKFSLITSHMWDQEMVGVSLLKKNPHNLIYHMHSHPRVGKMSDYSRSKPGSKDKKFARDIRKVVPQAKFYVWFNGQLYQY
ncbi:MAG: RHS repeat-associated core domain-containing protein [Flavobacteriales bacterium]|nr:RHS repeat-associated core domain-containing protein [Flavobacteriales bacterium]